MEHMVIVAIQVVLALGLGLSLVHLLVRHAYANRYRHHILTTKSTEWVSPSVDAIVACYNEDPELLEVCCASLAKQDYPGELSVYLVDDGSLNRPELRHVVERYGNRVNWNTRLLERNVGKRRAQDAVFRLGHGVLVECWDAYQRQTYAGVSCTTGDDLRLTNLVVAAGHRSVYAPLAKARTQVPEALSEYALQQLRWSRSFYRELMCTLSALRDRHLYLFVEVASRATFPLVVLFGLALGIATLLVGRSSGPVQGIGLLAILLAISAAVVLWQSRTFHYLLHGLLYLVVLPVHIYAIVT